jgi:hypothetical protein
MAPRAIAQPSGRSPAIRGNAPPAHGCAGHPAPCARRPGSGSFPERAGTTSEYAHSKTVDSLSLAGQSISAGGGYVHRPAGKRPTSNEQLLLQLRWRGQLAIDSSQDAYRFQYAYGATYGSDGPRVPAVQRAASDLSLSLPCWVRLIPSHAAGRRSESKEKLYVLRANRKDRSGMRGRRLHR